MPDNQSSRVELAVSLTLIGCDVYLTDGTQSSIGDMTAKMFRRTGEDTLLDANQLLADQHAKTNMMADYFRRRFAAVATAAIKGLKIGPPSVEMIFAAGDLELVEGGEAREISRVVLFTDANFDAKQVREAKSAS